METSLAFIPKANSGIPLAPITEEAKK